MGRICIKCGSNNPDSENYCLNCGAILPRISKGVVRPPRVKITKHYDIIRLKVEQLLAHEISYEEYNDTLDNIYYKIEEAGNTIENMEIPEELAPYFKEQIEIGLTGIDMFLEAINELRALPELMEELNNTESEEVRENIVNEIERIKGNALNLAAEATEHLNIALDMAMENMSKWTEEDFGAGFYV
ncbi:MAG: zinc ribbon domain-containing protein [Candidatus Calescibacterium sp.]|nr:zinc ribbon domain-containing protein [Candidatus Calescibacterium sp.]MCX7972627.1 zinc ribbon domain-containing protein [bacterium]MDW8194776.1 zinc ribbon domain-containing protein [Candidatus Calescibacterium sp.]